MTIKKIKLLLLALLISHVGSTKPLRFSDLRTYWKPITFIAVCATVGIFYIFKRAKNNRAAALKKKISISIKKAIDTQDEQGMTELHHACQSGDIETVKALIGKNANPNILSKRGRTPLLWAVIEGHIEIVRLLLKQKVDPNKDINDHCFFSPLYCAIKKEFIEIAELLIKYPATNINRVTEGNKSALYFAKQSKNDKIIGFIKARIERDKKQN